ncbi:hypothetical protein HRbin15_02484 [bacterium HR15]|nr:hypothetical protein HRbin15_02484 [bacterium HR15]
MRGLKEVLPLLIVAVVVVVILLSWIRTASRFIARSHSTSGAAAIPTPATGGFSGTTVMPPTPPNTHLQLRVISLAIQMYLQDYNQVLPPMNNPVYLEKILMPYAKQPNLLSDPISGTRFMANASLSFRPLNTIHNPADVIVFYQQKPDPQTGLRWVIFLDWHMKQVDAKQWQRLSKVSGISQNPPPSNTQRKGRRR